MAAEPKVEYPIDENYDDIKLSNVTIIFRSEFQSDLQNALAGIGVTGVTITQVTGFGTQKGYEEFSKSNKNAKPLVKTKFEVIVPKSQEQKVIDTACKTLYTGNVGDGKIFVYNVEKSIKIRTGEAGLDSLKLTQS